MPEITADMDRKNLTVQTVILAAPCPYEEGHVLTGQEAGVLVQTFHENLRNNFAGKVVEYCKKNGLLDENEKPNGIDAQHQAALQSEFDSYVVGYEFGVRSGGRAVLDPVMAQAVQLAEKQVKEAIKRKGLTQTEVGREKIRELAEAAIEKNPAFMKKAQEIVTATTQAADELAIEL